MLKVWENISYIYIYIVIILEILSLLIVSPEVVATEKERITICQSTGKCPTNSQIELKLFLLKFLVTLPFPVVTLTLSACLSPKADGFTLGYELNRGEVIMTLASIRSLSQGGMQCLRWCFFLWHSRSHLWSANTPLLLCSSPSLCCSTSHLSFIHTVLFTNIKYCCLAVFVTQSQFCPAPGQWSIQSLTNGLIPVFSSSHLMPVLLYTTSWAFGSWGFFFVLHPFVSHKCLILHTLTTCYCYLYRWLYLMKNIH